MGVRRGYRRAEGVSPWGRPSELLAEQWQKGSVSRLKRQGKGGGPRGARGWWWEGSVVRLLFDALDGNRQRRTRGSVGRSRV